MSSADSLRRKLEELRKKRADAARHEAEARKKQAAADSKGADYQAKAARASSPSLAKSYARHDAARRKSPELLIEIPQLSTRVAG